ncbi:MAG: low molecular weight phosphotyrosine protein phosphatase [Actinobacteria bacterium]|nr:low molecular weight phosphotyrosine protein phosphatase [Actinomycetota bacterium]
MRILMVCLGNICRSPTAEAALREAAAEAEVDVEVDSAGTGAWHVGNAPDERMTAAADEVGLCLAGAARQVTSEDLGDHDLVLAMDRENLRDLRALSPPDLPAGRIRLFREFDPEGPDEDVPDPYYGGARGFADVVTMTRRTARELVRRIDAGEL